MAGGHGHSSRIHVPPRSGQIAVPGRELLPNLAPGQYPPWRVNLSLIGLCEWAGRNWCRACKGVLTEPRDWESGVYLHRSCLVTLARGVNPAMEIT